MEKYFGRSIFNSMVVVATLSLAAYESISEDTPVSFSEKLFRETRVHFHEAMQSVFSSDVPEPPIIFISLRDTCEEVLRKVQEAKVPQDRLQLAFSHSICSRCGVKTKFEGKDQDLEMGISSYKDESGVRVIPSNETTCHPVIIPKYSELEKFFGGIAHIITFCQFVGRWPSFATMDEVCDQCKMSPGTRGCLKIGTKYRHKNTEIEVEHTNVLEERNIRVEDEAPSPP